MAPDNRNAEEVLTRGERLRLHQLVSEVLTSPTDEAKVGEILAELRRLRDDRQDPRERKVVQGFISRALAAVRLAAQHGGVERG